MNKISLPKYEELKKLMLINSGIVHMLPSDCKTLSDKIFKKNGNRISETTFKRIYGFAFSKYSPSLFTLDVLARYCGYKSWDAFCEKQDKNDETTSVKELSWQVLKQNADKITGFALQALKNKSGIPYNQTIEREFIDYHFDEFLNSNCTGTILCAPSGYGKTIALCQWIEKKAAIDTLKGNNDIILLFSSNAVMSVLVSGGDIHDWMLALLGYGTDNDINVLLDIKQRKDSKFYLIIDGFDEQMFKGDHFKIILNQLVDIFSFYQHHDWFKLILTTRTATWINNRHELEINSNTWFTGFNQNPNCINVPLLNLLEIEALCGQIKLSIENSIPVNIIQNFNHPLYFQFYYQQHKENFIKTNIDHISFYETLSTFILKKVYLGHYSTEKILLIKTLIEQLDITNNVYQINKLKIVGDIKKSPHAYQELINVGFIREFTENNNYPYNTYIIFGNTDFMEHSIAKTLLYNNGNLLDIDLVKAINSLLANNKHKVNVLKWCIMHAIKSGQLKNIEYIIEVQLTINEKSELITFLGEVLETEYSSTTGNDSIIKYFKNSFSDELFDYFFGLELINTDYKKFLHVLLKFDLSDQKKVLIHSTLAIIAAIQLDLNDFEINLSKLKAFPKAEYDAFSVNPLSCLDAIYYHLKYGIIKTEALIDLTKLYFGNLHTISVKKSASNDMLYLLGLFTMLLCNNPKKTLRFISFLNKNYGSLAKEGNDSQYGFFIKIFMSNAYLELGEQTKVSETYHSIAVDYEENEDLLTPYMKILFHSVKIKILLNTSQENLVPNEMKKINDIAVNSGYKFPKLYITSMLLQSLSLQNSTPGFYKQLSNDFNNIINECGLNPQLFLDYITVNRK
ncbi:MAG: hypothetical protein JWR50_2280 [Mucilaginibacter sp.]|nr:hypothetical protein [Mucilaginibacter sp.]